MTTQTKAMLYRMSCILTALVLLTAYVPGMAPAPAKAVTSLVSQEVLQEVAQKMPEIMPEIGSNSTVFWDLTVLRWLNESGYGQKLSQSEMLQLEALVKGTAPGGTAAIAAILPELAAFLIIAAGAYIGVAETVRTVGGKFINDHCLDENGNVKKDENGVVIMPDAYIKFMQGFRNVVDAPLKAQEFWSTNGLLGGSQQVIEFSNEYISWVVSKMDNVIPRTPVPQAQIPPQYINVPDISVYTTSGMDIWTALTNAPTVTRINIGYNKTTEKYHVIRVPDTFIAYSTIPGRNQAFYNSGTPGTAVVMLTCTHEKYGGEDELGDIVRYRGMVSHPETVWDFPTNGLTQLQQQVAAAAGYIYPKDVPVRYFFPPQTVVDDRPPVIPETVYVTIPAADPEAPPWEDLLRRLGEVNAATNPANNPAPNPNPNPEPNPDLDEPETNDPDPDTDDDNSDDKTKNTKKKLETVFPFCIPFDFIRVAKSFNALPRDPILTFSLPLIPNRPPIPLTLDMTFLNPVMPLIRFFELISFAVWLMFVTFKVIKW